jgi:hypothetical protein
VTWVSRERTEFRFQLATLNIHPYSSVGVRARSLAGKLCGLSGHTQREFEELMYEVFPKFLGVSNMEQFC